MIGIFICAVTVYCFGEVKGGLHWDKLVRPENFLSEWLFWSLATSLFLQIIFDLQGL
jgi:hypothetical protein